MTLFEEIGRRAGKAVADRQDVVNTHAFHMFGGDYDPSCDICLNPDKYFPPVLETPWWKRWFCW